MPVKKLDKIKLNQHLSMRIMLATSIYSIVVALFVSIMQINIVYQQALSDAKEDFKQIESGYIENLVAGLWVVDKEQINILLNGIADLPHVGYVELVDDTQYIFKRKDPNDKKIIAEQQYSLVYREGDFSYDLGSLNVQLTDQKILQEIKDKSISIAITTLITISLGSVFVVLIFQSWISKHLEKMARFADKLDVNHLDVPLILNRNQHDRVDELDQVVNSINQMQITLKDDLEKRRAIEVELVKHRERLEELVKERTAELTAKTYQLELQSKELETQNHELDAYAHSVAHDLKTPLTTIVGVSGLMQAGGITLSPEQTRESSAIINRTAKKMNAIIDALLLLASVRRNGDITPTIIDVRELTEEARQRLEPMLKQYNAVVELTGEWHKALGYSQWVEEVWVNYLSNAIKYGGASPRIQIGCMTTPNKMIKYWVRDHGEGIAIERRPELFLQFSRLDQRSSDGHGLGLSIVKRIINRLNGDVGYEDAENGGSIFWFTLPAAENTTVHN